MHYTEITPQFAADFFELAGEAKSICITTHMNADEDAIASILTMYRLLTDKYPNKNIQIIHAGEANERFRSFQNFEKIQFISDPSDHLEKFDLLIMLDGGNYDRFTTTPRRIKEFQGKTVCIDHHSSPPDEFNLSLIAPQIPSTAEVIYLSLAEDTPIDKPLAETFLLGILGDTGNLSFLRSDQSETFITAKKLVETGQVEISSLQARYRTIESKILNALGEFIKNTEYHKVEGWPDLQTSLLPRKFANQNNLTDKEIGETAEIYTAFFIRSIVGYKWGFTIRPKANGECNVSFRSLPEGVNVREIAERMGIGGGHNRAAGGTFKESDPQNCLNQTISWLKENKPLA